MSASSPNSMSLITAEPSTAHGRSYSVFGCFLFPSAAVKFPAMFRDYSFKELLAWIGGTLVAAVIVIFIFIMIRVVDYIAPHDANDPLVKQGGIKPEQEPKIGK
jgi:hypothetical protein